MHGITFHYSLLDAFGDEMQPTPLIEWLGFGSNIQLFASFELCTTTVKLLDRTRVLPAKY